MCGLSRDRGVATAMPHLPLVSPVRFEQVDVAGLCSYGAPVSEEELSGYERDKVMLEQIRKKVWQLGENDEVWLERMETAFKEQAELSPRQRQIVEKLFDRVWGA